MDKIHSLENTASIISNKAFLRLAEKTQVVFPKNGRVETVQNRLTHSYEVANSAHITEEAIRLPGLEIDYRFALHNTCLLHDCGHPPFGHEGAKLLDKRFKALGLKEGFSDNNNNFIVIEKNQIPISDYTKASLIKYPEKLYENQKDSLKRLLNLAIESDIRHFEKSVKIYKRPERTVACEIMDEVDRNCYVSSDLADCFSLGLSNEEPIIKIIEEDKFFSQEIREFLLIVSEAIKNKDKSLIKRTFNSLKVMLSKNYYLGDNLKLVPINEELIEVREALFKIETDIFIHSEEVLSQREEHLEYLNNYIDWVLEGNYPSRTYKKKIELAKTETEKLQCIRNMIGETTDWYVVNFNNK